MSANGSDLNSLVIQMHADWVEREEQFRACVAELESAAIAATERASELEREVFNLKSDAASSSKVNIIERRDGNERVELLEYIHCSLRECSNVLDVFRSKAPDNECDLWKYAIFVALPLAHHTVSFQVASGRFEIVSEWHLKVVRPIESFGDGQGSVVSLIESLDALSPQRFVGRA